MIFVNRAYRADGSDVENTRYQVWAAGGRPLTPGSTGPLSVENPPEFGRQEGDYEIIKPRYSAFFHTSLDLLLRRLGVDTVVLTGTTTPNCIRTTCYDAISLDYRVVILEDCCSSNTEEIQRANMADMANVGADIRASRDFLADLDGRGLTLRSAGGADVERCAEIEVACFPAAQAASREAMEARLSAYPDHVLLGEAEGRTVGYAMGPVIDERTIRDEMFADTGFHNPAGALPVRVQPGGGPGLPGPGLWPGAAGGAHRPGPPRGAAGRGPYLSGPEAGLLRELRLCEPGGVRLRPRRGGVVRHAPDALSF